MASLFTKISPATARLQTLACRAAASGAASAGSGKWRYSNSAGIPAAYGVTLYGTLGDGEFTVWLGEPDWHAAVGGVLEMPADAVSRLPRTLLKASLECLAADLLAGLEKAAGAPASVARLAVEQSVPLSSACRFQLVDGGGLRIDGAWAAAPGGGGRAWETLAGYLAALPAGERELPDWLPLAGAVLISSWKVAAAAMAGLDRDDVVLSPSGPERTLLVGGRLRFAAMLKQGILSVEGKTMTEAKAPGETDSVPNPGELARLDDVEVEVQAQVGKIALTLSQLKRLGAGQVVEFSTPVESPATLTVGGRAIAIGELVDVGGRVGVRITEIKE